MELFVDKYKNISGVEFSYKVSRSNVPDNANYYLYNILLEETKTNHKINLLLFIRKSQLHKSWNDADRFVRGRPLKFLNKVILDEYEKQTIPIKWPGGKDWFMWGFLPDI